MDDIHKNLGKLIKKSFKRSKKLNLFYQMKNDYTKLKYFPGNVDNIPS